jgi:hypothetical protein
LFDVVVPAPPYPIPGHAAIPPVPPLELDVEPVVDVLEEPDVAWCPPVPVPLEAPPPTPAAGPEEHAVSADAPASAKRARMRCSMGDKVVMRGLVSYASKTRRGCYSLIRARSIAAKRAGMHSAACVPIVIHAPSVANTCG